MCFETKPHSSGVAATLLRCLAFTACVLTLSLVCSAQVERATITGTLTDKNGAIVPDATVRITADTFTSNTARQIQVALRLTV